MPACVYLDQFAWVGVAKAHHGKSTDWADALDAMCDAKKTGTAAFPISLSHVNETIKRADDGSRGRLLDVMADLWDANAIRPWSQMRRAEIRNMVKKRLGLPQEDLDAWAFGRGIGHALGGEYRFIPSSTSRRTQSPSAPTCSCAASRKRATPPTRWSDPKAASRSPSATAQSSSSTSRP
jgi:hypothetical protein